MDFEGLVESFRRLGMTPEAARVAAVGRGDPFRGQPTEAVAREAWAGGSSAEIGRRATEALQEAHPAVVALPGEQELVEAAMSVIGMWRGEAQDYVSRVKLRESARGAGLGAYLRGVAAALRAAR